MWAFAAFFGIVGALEQYSKPCLGDPDCDDPLMYCNSENHRCHCMGNYLLDESGSCRAPSQGKRGSWCILDTDCFSNLVCDNFECSCEAGNKWNRTLEHCEPGVALGSSCVLDADCSFSHLFCNVSSYCDCKFGRGQDEECLKQREKNHGEFCVPAYIFNRDSCFNRKHAFSCIDYKCTCPSGQHWDGQKCLDLQHGKKCRVENDCSKDGLRCFKGKCQCPPGARWDGSACYKSSYGEVCVGPDHCSKELLLHCSPALSKCVCYLGFKWDPVLGRCVPGYGQLCVSDRDCATMGLMCNGICTCPPGQVWDGYRCQRVNMSNLHGKLCYSYGDCQEGLNLRCSPSVHRCVCIQGLHWDVDKVRCLPNWSSTKTSFDMEASVYGLFGLAFLLFFAVIGTVLRYRRQGNRNDPRESAASAVESGRLPFVISEPRAAGGNGNNEGAEPPKDLPTYDEATSPPSYIDAMKMTAETSDSDRDQENPRPPHPESRLTSWQPPPNPKPELI